LNGLISDDTLRGGPGNDLLNGGEQRNLAWKYSQYFAVSDRDIVDYSDLTAGGIRLDLSTMTVTGINGSDVGIDTLRGIEYLQGSRQSDVVVGSFVALSGSNEAAGDQHNLVTALYGGSDAVTLAKVPNMPWLSAINMDYWWSLAAVTATFSGSVGTISYGAGTVQIAGADTVDGVASFGDTAYNDRFDFSGMTSNFQVGSRWNNVYLNQGGNDTIVGNGDTTINFSDSATLLSTTGQGINVNLAAPGTSFTVDMTHLSRSSSWNFGTVTLNNIEGVQATNLDDTLVGGAYDDYESFRGKGGNDFIDGGTGEDRAEYWNGTSGITVNLAAGIVFGDSSIGTDTLRSIERIQGTAFDDIYDARGFSATSTNAGSWDQWNQFEGRGGNDTIYGNGKTMLAYGSSAVAVEVNLGTGKAWALNPADRTGDLNQYVGTDTFIGVYRVSGSALGDLLLGGGVGWLNIENAGELFDPGAGNDTVNGFGGWDGVRYSSSTAAITVDLRLTTSQVQDGMGGVDTLIGIEYVQGSAFNDVMFGSDTNNTGYGAQESFFGRKGNDTINGGGGYDEVGYTDDPTTGVVVNLATGAAQDGWGGTDTLSNIEGVEGSWKADSITGSSADNRLDGHGGNDTLDGGAGIDTAEYNQATGAVQVNLALGAVTGADGNDVLVSIENVTGSIYGDVLTGNSAANLLEGLAGADMLEGGGGNDTIDGGEGLDTAVFSGSRSGYTVSFDAITQRLTVADLTAQRDGSDVLIGIETLRFSDGAYAIPPNSSVPVRLFSINPAGTYLADLSLDLASSPTKVLLSDFSAQSGNIINLSRYGAYQAGNGLRPGTSSPFLDDSASMAAVFVDANGNRVAPEVFIGYSTQSQSSGLVTNVPQDFLVVAGGITQVKIPLGAVAIQFTVNDVWFMDNTDPNRDFGVSIQIADLTSRHDGGDYISGTLGNDTLMGYLGSDLFYGGPGNDLLNGGEQRNLSWKSGRSYTTNDYDAAVYFDLAAGGIRLDLSTMTVTGTNGADVGTDTLRGIESVRGTRQADSVVGNLLQLSGGNESAGDQHSVEFVGYGGGDSIMQGSVGNAPWLDGVYVGYWWSDAAITATLTGTAGTVSYGAAGNYQLAGTDALQNIASIGDTRLSDSFNFSGMTSSPYATYYAGTKGAYVDLSVGNDTVVGNGETTVNLSGTLVSSSGLGVNAVMAAGGAVFTIDMSHLSNNGQVVGVKTLSGINTLRGTSFNDTLVGGAYDSITETFRGKGGDDLINGMGGMDRADYLGSSSGVTVNLAVGAATGDGSIGTDTLRSVESIRGTQLDDTYDARGFSGTSTNGGSRGEYNIFEGRGGNDIIYGNGATRLMYTTSMVAMEVNLATGVAKALDPANQTGDMGLVVGQDTFSGVYRVYGSALGDLLLGGGLGRAFGETKAEVFDPAAGNDTVNGMGGWDGVVYFDAPSAITINMNLSSGQVQDGYGGTDTLIGIEEFVGSNNNDTMRGSDANPGGWEIFYGEKGNDLIDGRGGFDEAGYVDDISGVVVNLATGIATDGWGGTDTLLNIEGVEGSSFNDSLVGNAADNSLDGRGGNDTLNGGAGIDTAEYNQAAGAVQVNLALGTSTGADGNDTLISIENIRGGVFGDTLTGDANANRIFGGAGNDTIDGAAGTDVAVYAGNRANYTVIVNALGATVTDNVGIEGTDTLTRIEQVVFADQTLSLSSIAQLQGIAYDWKNHMLLQDVAIAVKGAGAPAEGANAPIQFKGLVWDTSGHASVEVWTHATTAVESAGFDLQITNASGITFTAGALPNTSTGGTGWTVITNALGANLTVGGFANDSTAAIAAGDFKLGTITFETATAQRADLHVINGDVGLARATAFGMSMARTGSDASGQYSLIELQAGSYDITASRAVTDIGNAITSADALAALKMAVGLNPNPDPDGTGPLSAPVVSPYQFMAADVVGTDWRVTSADALAILKMAVKLPTAPTKEWMFVEETRDFWNETTGQFTLTRNSTNWDHSISTNLQAGTANGTVNLVGVLKGDVNGSWAAPAGSTDLDTIDPTHFTALSSIFGMPVGQFGVV
jgi:Ca2+-binding RTX toxin-like protein